MRGDFRIIRDHNREDIVRAVRSLPEGFEVILRAPTRTSDQNRKMWPMLSDLSRAQPDGIKKSPDVWKCLLMHACEHEVRFEMGLNGEPFPLGYRSSKLSKAQFADLITFAYWYGDQHGVRWSEPNPYEREESR